MSGIADVLPSVKERLKRFVNDQRIPGLAVGIVRDQKLVWSQGFGAADLKLGEEPNEHTLSCRAILVGRLRLQETVPARGLRIEERSFERRAA